jgi:hypothetical protein
MRGVAGGLRASGARAPAGPRTRCPEPVCYIDSLIRKFESARYQIHHTGRVARPRFDKGGAPHSPLAVIVGRSGLRPAGTAYEPPPTVLASPHCSLLRRAKLHGSSHSIGVHSGRLGLGATAVDSGQT